MFPDSTEHYGEDNDSKSAARRPEGINKSQLKNEIKKLSPYKVQVKLGRELIIVFSTFIGDVQSISSNAFERQINNPVSLASLKEHSGFLTNCYRKVISF